MRAVGRGVKNLHRTVPERDSACDTDSAEQRDVVHLSYRMNTVSSGIETGGWTL